MCVRWLRSSRASNQKDVHMQAHNVRAGLGVKRIFASYICILHACGEALRVQSYLAHKTGMA